jgi:hypothetical protein
MSWKKLTFRERPCNLIEVSASDNADSLDYAGIYLLNKHDNNEYIKLSKRGIHSLSRVISGNGEIESWAFRKGFSNYEYVSSSTIENAAFSFPFNSGYGDSGLSVLCESLDPSSYEGGTTEVVTTRSEEDKILLNEKTKKENSFFEDKLSHEAFTVDEKLSSPIMEALTSNKVLFKSSEKTVNLSWQKIKSADGYRVEIFREEKGAYNSKIIDIEQNKFSFDPEGGNYFCRIKYFKKKRGKFIHGPYSEVYKFTKLYDNDCPEENITIHFEKYENKDVYIKVDGTWYGTGNKYGEPVSMVNFPCPISVEGYDYENNPNYVVFSLGRDRKKIVNKIDCKKYKNGEEFSRYIEDKYGPQIINQSCTISSIFKFRG